jgi:hypothetical protein
MYKRILLAGLISAMFSFSSCKQDKPAEVADTEAALAPGMIRLNLLSYGIPATIDIPDTSERPHIIESLPSGDLHIQVQKWFNITVNVSGMDMDRKKKDIAGNDVDKFQSWVAQDSVSILYKTQMVNEEFHFYAIIKKDGKTFYSEDHYQSTDGTVTNFSEPQVQSMLNAAKTLTPAKPAPAAPAAKS